MAAIWHLYDVFPLQLLLTSPHGPEQLAVDDALWEMRSIELTMATPETPPLPPAFHPPVKAPLPPPSSPPDLRALHRSVQLLLRPHSLSSFSHALTRDVVFVATGARRAILLDFALPPPALDALLTLCLNCHPLFAPLHLLRLSAPSSPDPAVLLVNGAVFLKEDFSTPVLVDADPSLTAPQLLPPHLLDALTAALHACTAHMRSRLSSAPSERMTDLHLPPSLPLPTLCGLLLSYPVVYTLSSALSSEPAPLPSANCLGSHPLRLHSVSIHPTPHLRSLCPSFAQPSSLCLSFTAPRGLVDEALAEWVVPAVDPLYFSHFTCSVMDVVQPHVSL